MSTDNLAYCNENDIELISKSNAVMVNAASKREDGFSYYKDAGTMQCPAGELAMRFNKQKLESGNSYYKYAFSRMTCKKCPQKSACLAVGKKENIYGITVLNTENEARMAFERSEEFARRLRIRYRIEEKNGEMKQAHGLRRADSTGLEAMRLQAYFTAFVVNTKRIVTLLRQKAA